jgi:hypothetical protein
MSLLEFGTDSRVTKRRDGLGTSRAVNCSQDSDGMG